MRTIDIRSRMILAAVLPVALSALLLAALFMSARVDDIGEAHRQRARSLTRQVATASEYGLFSANIGHLQSIAAGAMRQSDVRSVLILDTQGTPLASAGTPYPLPSSLLGTREGERYDEAKRADLLWQPITESLVKLDDLFDAKGGEADVAPHLLGYVVIEFSRKAVYQRERDTLLLGLAITLGGLGLGIFLAVRLSRRVARPIFRVFHLLERIGQGELSARAVVRPDDPLRDLQHGLNQMAERLERGRDELEQRVAVATVALREKKEEAETATLAKSRFLAAASHDLRQPTHALGMFVARLAQLPHDAETQHLIGKLDDSVRAMQDLLDGLLDISRLDAGAVQVHIQPIALADLFEQLQSSLSVSAEEKGLRLRIRPTRQWLMSDPALLYRILMNLAVNALRYTPAGSVLLACRVSADGRVARLEVRDSGIGIAAEHQSAIFKEFYQVGNAARDRSKGLGLGLNIVQRTAHLLGHPLSLRSAPGRGTCFSLCVPLVAAGTPVALADTPENPAFDELAGLSVLVIEDDALAREGLVALLESWGGVVQEAESLAGALSEMALRGTPDVIISDFRLRGGDNGIEVIRQLRAHAGQQIAACLMSGNTDVDLIQAAKREGLTLLHKPVRPAKLRSLVRRLAREAQASGSCLT